MEQMTRRQYRQSLLNSAEEVTLPARGPWDADRDVQRFLARNRQAEASRARS